MEQLDYTPCGVAIEGGDCMRYSGHKVTEEAGHRLTLRDPAKQAKWEQAATVRAAAKGKTKAAPKATRTMAQDNRVTRALLAKQHPAEAVPVGRRARQMGSGPVARVTPEPANA